jgi:hypothetical protein
VLVKLSTAVVSRSTCFSNWFTVASKLPNALAGMLSIQVLLYSVICFGIILPALRCYIGAYKVCHY